MAAINSPASSGDLFKVSYCQTPVYVPDLKFWDAVTVLSV